MTHPQTGWDVTVSTQDSIMAILVYGEQGLTWGSWVGEALGGCDSLPHVQVSSAPLPL
jgi:hypothetical protein